MSRSASRRVIGVASAGRGRVVAAGGALAGGGADNGFGRGLGKSGVVEIQRARIIAAMVEVARERGAGQVTVAHVVARAGVSRRTFYELFEDREACYLAAFDEAVRRAAVRVIPAFEGGDGWRARLRAGLCALLEFMDDEPGLGAFCVVDALGAGPHALARRGEVIEVLIDAVDAGRAEVRGGVRPTRLTAEGVVGAVLGVLHARVAGGQGRADRGLARGAPVGARGRALTELLGPLMGIVVLPYQGAAVAARESARAAPRRRRPAPQQRDPLSDLDMRLTYRTVRVLVAIAAAPDASNREIADASGIHDQGQISKLLARLGHLGLVENHGGGSVRGEPNAWRLTARGRDVEHTIHQQTTIASAAT
jgi:AcrR family transcriptional regulator/DNA-binding MarR family transcriptional regulator